MKILRWFLSALLLAACSIEIAEVSTPTRPAATATPPNTPTPVPLLETMRAATETLPPPSLTPTRWASRTPTLSPVPSATPLPTATRTAIASSTRTPAPRRSATPTLSPPPSATPTATLTPSITPTRTPGPSPTSTASASFTPTPTASPRPSATFTLPPSATATPTLLPTATIQSTASATPFNITPPTGPLAGKLIFTGFAGAGLGSPRLYQVNLALGEVRTLFSAPETAWLSAVSASPDGTRLVVAYAPPPPAGEIQFGYTGLYTLPADGSGPLVPFIERTASQESFFSPQWSPDGQYIYFGHLIPTGGASFRYIIERAAYPSGAREQLIPDAFWPRLSPDGARLAYVYVGSALDKNDLYISDAEGGSPQLLAAPPTFDAVDAPLFTPDGNTLLFSAVGSGPTPALAWLDWLMGVQSAEAHSVPSDWWSVPVAGGAPTRLTAIAETGMFADFAPDGAHIAFIGQQGGYVMNADGSGVTLIFNIPTQGTLDWVP